MHAVAPVLLPNLRRECFLEVVRCVGTLQATVSSPVRPGHEAAHEADVSRARSVLFAAIDRHANTPA
jgi:hypothetical protein